MIELTFETKGKLFGKRQLRLVLHLLGKELRGREAVQYDDMDAIAKKFQDDVKGRSGSASTPGSSAEKMQSQ